MAPLKQVGVKYKNRKRAVQNPDCWLVLKRNKLSGTVNSGLYGVNAVHFALIYHYRSRRKHHSVPLNTIKMHKLSYK